MLSESVGRRENRLPTESIVDRGVQDQGFRRDRAGGWSSRGPNRDGLWPDGATGVGGPYFAASHALRAASWSGFDPSGRRSPLTCQKKTPRKPCLIAQSVFSAIDSASS